MDKIILITIFLSGILFIASDDPNVLPESTYPYWPSYQYLKIDDLDNVKAQRWINKEHVIEDWDWSLPTFEKPSQRSLIGLQQNYGWDKDFIPMNFQFKSNSVGLLWVKWRDIEPTMGNYDFSPIIERIKQANSVGVDIILRILCHSKARGTGSDAISKGEAPLWLENLGVNLLPREDSRRNLNFDPSHPEFHKRYLMLINEMSETNIPSMVKAAYVGYASHALGDEGIGPYKKFDSAANDTVKHVRERLDAWHNAFKGMEYKVFMGAPSKYGFEKGFGTRNGFIEMYLYRVPERDLGQYIDDRGYLCVDESAPIIKFQCFNGEVNEAYQEAWTTDKMPRRFGNTTNSFPYRYFMSTLRALQMRCTYIHTEGHLIPKMLPFLSQELGRTVEDTPDIWAFLNTSYLRASTYKNNDYKNRSISSKEKEQGIEMKNFERWLYQRDAPGYETEPTVKIQHAIKMWMVEPDKYYDYIARKGKKMGFDVDDRWKGIQGSVAIKVTYIDNYPGELNMLYNNGQKQIKKTQSLNGDGALRTVTFFISNLRPDSFDHNFDFILEAGENTSAIDVSFVRVVQIKTPSNGTSLQKKYKYKVYPNPFSNFVHVACKESNKLEIYDSKGNLVIKTKKEAEPMRLNLNHMPNGVYFVYSFNAREKCVTKLIKISATAQ